MGSGSRRGLAMSLLAAASFGASPFATSLLTAGWSPGALVLVRVLGSVLLLAPPALIAGRGHRVTAGGVRQSLLFGFFGVAGVQYCFYNALGHLDVGLTLLIEYSGVLLVVLWLWLVHGHRPKPPTVIGGLVALVGLFIALDLIHASKIDTVGVLWGCGGAVGTGAYYLISAGSHRTGWPALTTVWAGLAAGGLFIAAGCATGLLPVRTAHRDVVLVHHHLSWLVGVAGMTVLTGAIAYALGVTAARLLGARNASFLGLTEVLFGMLFARILIGQTLGATQLLGGLLVLAGVTVVQLDEGLAVTPEPLPQPHVAEVG